MINTKENENKVYTLESAIKEITKLQKQNSRLERDKNLLIEENRYLKINSNQNITNAYFTFRRVIKDRISSLKFNNGSIELINELEKLYEYSKSNLERKIYDYSEEWEK